MSVPTLRSPAGRRVLRNVLFLGSSQLTSWTLALLWTAMVPRRLGPQAIGEFVIAMSVTGVVGAIVKLGVGTLLVRDIARERERAGPLVGSALVLSIAAVIPSAGLVVLYLELLHFGSEQAILIWLASAVMLIAAASGVISAGLTGLEQMQYLAYANVIGNGLVAVVQVALVVAGFGVVALMEADVVLTALILLLNLVWMRPHFTPRVRLDLAEMGYIVKGSLSFWIGGLVFTTYLWIDTVILSALAPAVVVGWYGVPTQIFNALLAVASILGTAMFPRFAAAFAQGPECLRAVARPGLELIIVLGLPIGAGTAVIAWPVTAVVYGPGFFGAAWVLVILALTVIPTFLNMGVYQVLMASNRQRIWIWVVASVTVVNPLLNLALVSYFQGRHHNGAIGAALSLLITEIIQSICALALVPWLLDRRFLLRLLRTVVATATMVALVYAVGGHATFRWGVIVQVGVGALTFTALCWLLRLLRPEEIEELHAVGARLQRRLPVIARAR